MKYYQKVLLYAYPNLEKMIKHIDKMVLSKALASYSIYTPCFTQAEEIVKYTLGKEKLLLLKKELEEIFATFNKEDFIYLEYKYFKRRDKETESLDTVSRKYFRRQNKLLMLFSKKLMDKNLNSEWFRENYFIYPYFKELLKKVERQEERVSRDRLKKAV
ncbi:MAG: hypothetical protein E7342_00220 [Clostridiales bacterium]|nr:hypothetical protein [Clostridiales bacterium]